MTQSRWNIAEWAYEIGPMIIGHQQESAMSRAQSTNLHVSHTHKPGGYGFILALLCIAGVLVIVSATSSMNIGKEINEEVALVGP